MCKKGKVIIIIIIAATIWGALTVGQTLCQALWFSTDALTGLEATKISIYHLLGLQVRSQALRGSAGSLLCPHRLKSGYQQGGLHSCHQRVIQGVGKTQFHEAAALRASSP